MTTIRIEPLGVEVPLGDATSVMRAAEAHGLKWPTVCFGDAACGICFVSIADADAAGLPEPTEKELAGLDLVPRFRRDQPGQVVRLACQLRPIADLTVTKRGVRSAT